MTTMTTRNKTYRLEIGGAGDRSATAHGRPHLYLVHANDQEVDDDFEGRRNWTFPLVLCSAGVAGLTMWAGLVALF